VRLMVRQAVPALLVLGLFAANLSAQNVVATAPMEIGRDLPQVRVMVNGQGPFTFGIDTGAGTEAVVMAALVQQLKLPVTGEDTLDDPTGVGSQKVPVVTIRSLNIAGVEFTNLKASQFAGPMLPNVDGILGFLLFRDYLFTLDYPRQQFTLTQGNLPAADGQEIVPFRMPDNIPVIELSFGTQKIDAHIDSGGKGLSVPAKFAENLKFASDLVVLGKGATVANSFEIKGARIASDVHLGAYTFSNPFVEVNPIFPTGNFGSYALRSFAITFDQKKGLVRFAAADKTIVLAGPKMMRAPQSQPQSSSGSNSQ
jgi:Aspartyl protease